MLSIAEVKWGLVIADVKARFLGAAGAKACVHVSQREREEITSPGQFTSFSWVVWLVRGAKKWASNSESGEIQDQAGIFFEDRN